MLASKLLALATSFIFTLNIGTQAIEKEELASIQPPKVQLSDANMSLESLTIMGIDVEVAMYMIENDCDSITATKALKRKKKKQLENSSWDLCS